MQPQSPNIVIDDVSDIKDFNMYTPELSPNLPTQTIPDILMNKTLTFEKGESFGLIKVPHLPPLQGGAPFHTAEAFWSQRDKKAKKTIFSIDTNEEVDKMLSSRPPTGLQLNPLIVNRMNIRFDESGIPM